MVVISYFSKWMEHCFRFDFFFYFPHVKCIFNFIYLHFSWFFIYFFCYPIFFFYIFLYTFSIHNTRKFFWVGVKLRKFYFSWRPSAYNLLYYPFSGRPVNNRSIAFFFTYFFFEIFFFFVLYVYWIEIFNDFNKYKYWFWGTCWWQITQKSRTYFNFAFQLLRGPEIAISKHYNLMWKIFAKFVIPFHKKLQKYEKQNLHYHMKAVTIPSGKLSC